jgi:hypothetical protein
MTISSMLRNRREACEDQSLCSIPANGRMVGGPCLRWVHTLKVRIFTLVKLLEIHARIVLQLIYLILVYSPIFKYPNRTFLVSSDFRYSEASLILLDLYWLDFPCSQTIRQDSVFCLIEAILNMYPMVSTPYRLQVCVLTELYGDSRFYLTSEFYFDR